MSHQTEERNTQIHVAKTYAVEFGDKTATQEAREENSNPEVFVLGIGVKHRPSKRRNIVDTFVTKNQGNK